MPCGSVAEDSSRRGLTKRTVIASLSRKIVGSVRKQGVAGTLAVGVRVVWKLVRLALPGNRQKRLAAEERSRHFDEQYGVQTAGSLSLFDLHVESENRNDGVRYEPVDPDEFRALMDRVGDVSGHTFVDFGAGMGRAMFLAANYPFARIVGVEFAAELVEKCRANLRTYRNPQQQCSDLEIVAGDACDFAIPEGPLVLFLYNPFGKTVMNRVIDNVRQSLIAAPRPLTVVYNTSFEQELWLVVPDLAEVPSIPGSALFRNALAAGARQPSNSTAAT